ncbi:DNA replication/repair protein RecF [Candidatus Roizmanbacteria bacterium]|nr:DNA replication/repair protein RecF [Candidatus Roizmanbacteria bacterium]
MLLKQLVLINFRNFSEKKIDLNPSLTLIIGKNSLGKTNILEGIYFFVNGLGFREIKEEELLSFGKDEAIVEGVLAINENEDLLSAIKMSLIDHRISKKFFINKTEKKHSQYFDYQVRTILFSPEQINIIIGSPQLRRDYFDKIISVFDLEYKKKLINYQAALRRRNKVLELRIPVDKLREELKFWDEYLIEQGSYLTKKRQAYIDFLNSNQDLDSKKFSIVYQKNEITELRLKESFPEAVRFRKTLIGPQKDDFQIFITSTGKKNVHHFGSRSEQRLAVFWLKINEIKYLEKYFKKKPIILLDDIFSELDQNNQKIIVPLISRYQTVATTTEESVIGLIKTSKSVIKL